MKPKPEVFRPGWVVYPHTKAVLIVFSEADLAEQEAHMGGGEYIREATKGERDYQTSGIPEMVAQYFSYIMGTFIEDHSIRDFGVAS